MARQRPTRIPTPHRCYIKRQLWGGKAYVGGAPGWVMLTWMVEMDRVVIRDVTWSLWAGRPRIDRIVIREVQYQLKVNRCRNEEVIFQGSSVNSDGQTYGQTDGQTADGDNHILNDK
ncbi:hypothetical protein DPMN_072536 [Dreissena polymorpha]|uniref:Uncharacterized protein n=1 Tax=Dreissena polymorpha TaxID=45954 RepID=A0A9D3Z6E0_DREPO|nr:hypothetical protein DPMN_072536 [Dreissena polymorpha]